MQANPFAGLQPRSQCRYELRSLAYVTLDGSNRGVIRNLSHQGAMVQALTPLHSGQQVKLSFDLRQPRIRVEAEGQVSWANTSGACGIRFIGLSEESRRRVDEWIFSNLLESLAREGVNRPIFGAPVIPISPEENGNLIISGAARPAIRMPSSAASVKPFSIGSEETNSELREPTQPEVAWLSQPLSPRTLAWLVNSLVFTAGLLLFALIFLAIVHEVPRWPFTLGASLAAAALVAGGYWALFAAFGGSSFGTRVAGLQFRCERRKTRVSTSLKYDPGE
jgi:hypothetical protein